MKALQLSVLAKWPLIALLSGTFASAALSQSLPAGSVWTYTLVNGSQLLDDCPICDRATIAVPMRGTFQLRFVQQGPLFFTYALDNISFTATGNAGSYKITGKGVYQVGGEIATQQSLSLQVQIDDGLTNQLCYLTNGLSAVTRLWPMLQVPVDQTNGTLVRQFHLQIDAAPLREIWFSTTQRFQAGAWHAPTNMVAAGDLLSWAGRELKTDLDFARALGIQFAGVDLGLKDVDVLPGGEIAFSFNQSAFSSSLGTLQPGDLLSDRGRILRTNLGLVTAFVPAAPVPADVGLGALQIMDTGEIWFSTQTNFFSKALGRELQPGDLLSDQGLLVRSNAQLLAAFNPVDSTNDYGLNSIYVWPSGEIWFSTAKAFLTVTSNSYSPGDLLSDQGYLVYSNAELLAAFAPTNAPTTLGLDALYIVTDVIPGSAPPQLGKPLLTNSPPFSVAFPFKASGHVFQLERAAALDQPFTPVTPITTDQVLIDPGARSTQSQGFYRLRQW